MTACWTSRCRVVLRVALCLAALRLPTLQAQSRSHARVPAPARDHAELAVDPIDSGWEFRAVAVTPAAPKAVSPESVLKEHPEVTVWRPASVPGTVHTDLAAAGVIPPPFVGDNEKRLQWIGEVDWEYRTTVHVSAEQMRQTHAEMVFEGLDTFAEVSLNGEIIVRAENMFRGYTADVRPTLHLGDNTLTILFHSAINHTAPMVAKLPYILPGTGYEPLDPAHGIYPVGQYQRKAGYEYGWDWGPRFVTSGVFRPIHLDTWSGDRIRSVHVAQTSISAERAIGEARVQVESDQAGPARLEVTITPVEAGGGSAKPTLVRTTAVQLDGGANQMVVPFRLEHPALWWPAGYGLQSRYRVTARVLRGVRVTAAEALTTGFRSIQLRRSPDQWGVSFEFVVNGVPIFAKGANVVPLDSFPPATTDAKKRDLLTSARDANMNMLRIWGGGFYETDSFYDLCDELGLMVWHDFMFGGGMVPGDRGFEANVAAEAEAQVTRLSDHPAMALWNGNNEVETAWNNWDGTKQFIASITPDQRERVWQDYVVMFRDILKRTVAMDGNGVPYWPSSPSANFEDVAGNNENGDVHSWKVWSAGAPITEYTETTPRFLSEFGFQSLPDLRTMESVVGANTDLDSPEVVNHERFVHGFARMRQYLGEYFRPSHDFGATIYLSQLLQAEAIRVAVDHARTNRPRTMGTLFWQLDDCWPVASWSSLDYFGRWKALQYWARHFYAPITIAPEVDDAAHTLRLHVISDDTRPHTAVLHVRLMRFDGTLLNSPVAEQRTTLTVPPLASLPVDAIPAGSLPGFDARSTVAVVTLEPVDGAKDPAEAWQARSNFRLDEAGMPKSGRQPGRALPGPASSAGPAVSNSPGAPPYPLLPSAEVTNPDPPATLAERTIYFASTKDLALTDPHIATKIERDATGYTISLTSEALATAVQLSFGNLNWKLSDNFFDLLPHQRKAVHLTTTATEDQIEAALHVRSLYSATTH